MTTNVGDFAVKDAPTIRNDYLRTYSNYMTLICGVTNPNVAPGSDVYGRATAFGVELEPLYANGQIQGDQLMPDTAQGTNAGDPLARIGAAIGLSPRNAAGSTGFIVYATSQTSLVATGDALQDETGLVYQVSVGGTYANNAFIPIAAVSTGSATNLAAGTSLRWQTAPAYSAPTALVATGGLTNGTDVEDQETFRARILARLANPVGAGTSQFAIELAEGAHPSVQRAFCYPAILGPATMMIACAGFSDWNTSESASRELNATVVSNVITGVVQGNLPEHVAVIVTGVIDSPTDVTFQISLPSSPAASPPGPGGGWLDGTPWPANTNSVSNFSCSVTSVASSTQFTVNAPSAPTAGATRIAWLSPTTWLLNTATVLSVTGSTGAYTITIDTPFVGIAAGNFIFPQSVNQQNYVDAVMTQFGLMGPGEGTTNASALQRAFRHPTPAQSFPYSLDARMLRAIEDAGTEVLSAAYYYRSQTTPAVPTPGSAPNVLIPRNIGFYA